MNSITKFVHGGGWKSSSREPIKALLISTLALLPATIWAVVSAGKSSWPLEALKLSVCLCQIIILVRLCNRLGPDNPDYDPRKLW